MTSAEVRARVDRLTLLLDVVRLASARENLTVKMFADRVAGVTERHAWRLLAELKDLAPEFGVHVRTEGPPKGAPAEAWRIVVEGDDRALRWIHEELARLGQIKSTKWIADWHRRREAALKEKGLCIVCEQPHAGGGPICQACAERLNEMRGEKILARRLAGMCQDCGEVPPENGLLFCRACLDRRNVGRQRIREARAEEGICPYCGREPSLPGARVGAECKRKFGEDRVRIYGERRAAGECIFCSAESPDRAVCEACRLRTQEGRERRIEEGKCPECGEPIEPGFRACKICREKKRDYLRKLRAERREKGLCVDCGEPALAGKPRCGPHTERARQASLDYARRKASQKRGGEST
jgi:hypothetical protein